MLKAIPKHVLIKFRDSAAEARSPQVADLLEDRTFEPSDKQLDEYAVWRPQHGFYFITLREGRMPGLRRITIYACSSLSHVTRGTMVPAVWCRPKSCKGGIDRTKCFRGQRHSMGVAWKVHEYVTTACRSRGYLLRKYLLGMSMQISSYYHDGVVRVHWPIISSWAHSEIYVHFAEGKWSAIVF